MVVRHYNRLPREVEELPSLEVHNSTDMVIRYMVYRWNLAVLGWWLDLMILRVFSNLDYSKIPVLHDTKEQSNVWLQLNYLYSKFPTIFSLVYI